MKEIKITYEKAESGNLKITEDIVDKQIVELSRNDLIMRRDKIQDVIKNMKQEYGKNLGMFETQLYAINEAIEEADKLGIK